MAEWSRSAAEVIPLEDMTPAEQIIVGVEVMSAVDARLDAQAVPARAPEPIRKALRLIYYHDKEMQKAAPEVGLSRYQLHDRISKFSAGFRNAA